mmetsp:Transcript_17253/g.65818  ORF Transcript_17253/g.65818 Transcript_17253/m.65818 type:complete len:143 (-) Transcript_17253:229-657(-)
MAMIKAVLATFLASLAVVGAWKLPKASSQQLSQAALLLALSAPLSTPAVAQDLSGEKIFNAQCSICHANGGNAVFGSLKKTLSLEALNTYGYGSKEGIASITTNGAGVMPRFGGKDDKPGVLATAEIDAVADYVWAKAQSGW